MDAVKPVSHPLVFGLLGPLDLTRGNRPVALGPAKQRLLLAGLLLRPNQLVSIPDLTAILWGATPPASSVANLRTYVRGLHASLNAEGEPQSRLTTTRGAYQLRVAPDERDVDRFDAAAARGRAALGVGDASRARAELARAVALWRGAPLGDLTLSPPLAAHAARLKERLLLVEEDRAAALLALGAEAETVSRLRVLLEHYPMRQRAWEQLMLGLYRVGDVAGALDAYRQAKRALAEQTGLDPAPRLSRLHDDILHHRASLTGPRTEANSLVALSGRTA